MPHPVTLVLREKVLSWTGDDFGVKDTNGNVVVSCNAKMFSIRNKKTITDPNGQFLFGIQKKILRLLSTFVAVDANDNEIFRVKNKIAFGSKMHATFVNASTGQPTTISLRGDIIGRSADLILDNGQVVAQIKRDILNATNFFTGQDTYYVVVAPGVDLSLITAICICFDEVENDHHKR
ncbi:uncharacterized protein EHS24_003381 [Apiotrichum porosum]|uniref:Phospholipid scramblase n=1 Tax=Apiotrichum porosum TaxID=105984 RepID=A0A427XEX5_9TREE|nr:uncharacterized protein EHS24_003381 [Apiotrichum porosum]RSH77415.1 hypothetical protein EHS24_003381 [Apiotrichum porosum]